ncbi:MAG: HAD family hydrolase [Phycisphaeraceae bacterium]
MTPPIQQLLLFDIDGTLMITRGMTSRCIERTGKQLFEDSFVMGSISPGRLDQQLFSDIAGNNGITLTHELLAQWKVLYFDALENELASKPEDIIVLPGVRELWEAVHAAPGVAVGLLTGNFRKASHLKLDAAKIDTSRLYVEVHGEDAEDRVGLVHVAMHAMAEQGTTLDPQQVIILGDTPRDIACARGAGCRCLAVATGRYGADQLAEHSPDILFNDLLSTRDVLASLSINQ